MFPFISLGNQFFSDLYASSAYYGQGYYIVPDDGPLAWNNPHQEDNSHPHILPNLAAPSEPEKQDCPTQASQRPTKNRERRERQSSVEAEALEEESQASPEVRLRQKYGRNINSNIFHHMLKKIVGEDQYQILISKIIGKHSFSMSSGEFTEMLSKKVSRLPSYISLGKMKRFFTGSGSRASAATHQRQREFLVVLRCICRHYLRNVHVLCCFNVLKIKKESKNFHVTGCRKIAELMK